MSHDIAEYIMSRMHYALNSDMSEISSNIFSISLISESVKCVDISVMLHQHENIIEK